MTHRREIDDYVDELYAEAHETERVKEKKEEISMKLSESMREFEQSGVSDQDAFEEAIVNTKNLQGFTDRCENKNILDSIDYITGNYILPLGTMLMAIFVGWYWTKDQAIKRSEINTPILQSSWYFIIRYIVPVAILVIAITSIVDK